MAAQSPQSEEPADGAILSFLKYGENTGPVYLQGDWEMGIAKVTGQKQADGVIYDLQGRKVGTNPSAQLKKGIYIIGGKKAIIK